MRSNSLGLSWIKKPCFSNIFTLIFFKMYCTKDHCLGWIIWGVCRNTDSWALSHTYQIDSGGEKQCEFFNWCYRETGRKRERKIDLLFYLFMHSLVDSCMGSDWGSNPQPWCMGWWYSNQLNCPARVQCEFLNNQSPWFWCTLRGNTALFHQGGCLWRPCVCISLPSPSLIQNCDVSGWLSFPCYL